MQKLLYCMYIYIIMEDVLIFVGIENVHLFQFVLSHNYLPPVMVTSIIMDNDITLIQSIPHMTLYLNISRKLDVTRFMLIWGKNSTPKWLYLTHFRQKHFNAFTTKVLLLFIFIYNHYCYYHHHHYNYCCYLSMLFLLLLSSSPIVIFFIIIIINSISLSSLSWFLF